VGKTRAPQDEVSPRGRAGVAGMTGIEGNLSNGFI
jgi:hypothetical protein